MTLGETISTLRKKAGLTQEELAKKLGVSGQAVSKWENDLSYPDITFLPNLADEFGCTVDDILRGNVDNNENFDYDMESEIDNNVQTLTLPSKLVKIAIKLGADFGGLNSEELKILVDAVDSGLKGEILKFKTEEGTIRIVLK